MVVYVKNLKVKKRDLGKVTPLVDGVLKATNFKTIFDYWRESFSSRSMFMLLFIAAC